MWVASERQRLSRAGSQALDPARIAFEAEAEPEEQDMSDEELMAVANAARAPRRR